MMLHQHTESDMVAVRDKRVTLYYDTPQNFQKDFGLVMPALPVGIFERIYDQGERHTMNGDSGMIGGPMPWPEGDAIISMTMAAVSAQAARRRQEQALVDASAAQVSTGSRNFEAEIDELRARIEALERKT